MEHFIDNKYNIITSNLAEILVDEPKIKAILTERNLRIYWGTAPTGRIHLGYFLPLLKILDFIRTNCDVIIFLADLHAVLDNLKSTPEQIEYRTLYYKVMITEVFKSFGVNTDKIRFVKGTEFQLTEEYTLEMYKIHTKTFYNDCKHAGAEVVKQSHNPVMTSLLYPSLQALDEKYLMADIELGGIDQRKIFVHARKFMPTIGNNKCSYLMNELVPGLRYEKNNNNKDEVPSIRGQMLQILETEKDEEKMRKRINKLTLPKVSIIAKMSSSDNNSKIDLLDTAAMVKKKINRAYCLEGDVEDNCLLTMLDKIIMPILRQRGLNFDINRKVEYGGNINYSQFVNVQEDFFNKELHPADLKAGIVQNINIILEPIRIAFEDEEMKKLLAAAYP